jgi:hypothetical protein
MPVPDQHDPGSGGTDACTRTIGYLETDQGDRVRVDHVYLPGVHQCGNCQGDCVDPGAIGLVIFPAISDGDPEADVRPATAMMTPAETLILINRLTRAANLALETSEDPPDLSREMQRLTLEGTGDDS